MGTALGHGRRWRWWALWAAGLAAMTIGGVSAADAGPRPLAVPACDITNLTGVSMTSADDGWAVGYHFEKSYSALALHWDGTSWTRADIPRVGRESYFYAVDAYSPTLAFAVGISLRAGGFKTLVMAWDGHQWTQMPSASPNDRDSDLYGVTVLSPTDAWAVGAYGFRAAKTLTLHYDGTAWQRVSSPYATSFDFLQSVAGTGPRDVWAVGGSEPGTLTMHWGGSKWTLVRSPGGRFTDLFLGVAAVSSSDVWTVGRQEGSLKTRNRVLVAHWAGSAWDQVDAANPGRRSNALNGIDALRADDAWAVGSYRDAKTTYALAEHWDGSTWAPVEVPGAKKTLNSVSIASTDDAWAVGNHLGRSCLIEHWDGSDWSQVG